MESKPKVLIWSDLVTHTGFERVSSSIFSRLTNELDLAGLGINYRGDPNQYKFPVFPASTGGDLYGLGRIKEFVKDNLDAIFILNDVWVVDKFLEQIKKSWDPDKRPKIIVYFPVDAEEHDADWYKNFDIVDVPVTYTEFGRRVVIKAAPELKDRLLVIPHGTDTKTFFPIERAKARTALFGPDRANDDFIFLNTNRNQPRKKLDITMEGFKLFSEGRTGVKLYMHCGVIDAHLDIGKYAHRLGIDKQLILSNLQRGPQQVPDQVLNLIYNSCDVGVNTGLGEGWGLPAVEHAATGNLQLVPGHSACKELFQDCGIIIPTRVPWVFDQIMTEGRIVSAEDVAEAMSTAYSNTNLRKKLSEAAFAKFTSEEYSWDVIAKRWLSVVVGEYEPFTLADPDETNPVSS